MMDLFRALYGKFEDMCRQRHRTIHMVKPRVHLAKFWKGALTRPISNMRGDYSLKDVVRDICGQILGDFSADLYTKYKSQRDGAWKTAQRGLCDEYNHTREAYEAVSSYTRKRKDRS
jgi:hypothetical protein